MSKTNKNKTNQTQNNTEQSKDGKKNGLADLYTHEIADAFSKQMQSKHDDYFSRSKEQIVKDFEQFVEQEYGNHILQALKDGKITGKSLDIEMNAIADKGFMLSDFLDNKKGEVIQNNFNRITKEQDVMEQGLFKLYQERDNLPPATKNKLVFDDFIHSQGYRKITNPSGDIMAITTGHNHKSHNIQTLQKAWKEYVHSVTNDADERDSYISYLDMGHFDPTEKIVTVSAVCELYENIQRKTKGQQRQNLLDLADSIFEKRKNPISSDLTWTTMSGLSVAMKDFFQQAGSLADQDQLKSLQDMRLTLKDCMKIAEDNKLLESGVVERQLFNKKYSDVNRQFQNMANSFVQADLINNIDEIIETVDEEIDEYAKIFDVPGNMSNFFEQFGTPSQLMNTYTDPAYITLKRREHDLRELLAKAGISQSDKESYTAELVEVKGKINAHKNTHQVSTWDGYFDHIAQQIDTAHAQTGIAVSGSDVKSVLQDLRDNNWDVSTLGSGQNILMKASIALQLLKVKDSHSFQTLGYSFQSYAQFVSSLYDLESQKTTILTQDNVPIELNFTSKKFVGKPLEFHNIDVDDISSLSDIRVEFELDVKDNIDAEQFIRTMTGGPNSHLVQDFFPQQPGFPETMTDSSFVEMVDKNGVRYEGYLSPTHIINKQNIDDDIYGNSDPQQSAKTYILYTKPADQLHLDREFVTQKDSNDTKILTESGKEKPVYINSSNLTDWQSIDIKEKKVTLSDGHLKALTLGHMVAQSVDASQLLDPKNSQHVQNMIAQQDASIAQGLQENNRDIGSEVSQDIETPYESLSSAEEFSQSWESLLGGKHLCEVGSRIAVTFPKIIEGKKTLKTFPDTEQLLSMTIKDLKKDEQGKIIGATFGFDTLSRIGKCTLKDITLEGKQLDKIGETFKGGATYIDNIHTDPQDYKSVLGRLENNFSDSMRKKTYLWDTLKPLDFDGTQFKKNGKNITHFVSTQKTEDAKQSNSPRYDVEYKVERLWSNKYRITSTPFKENVTDKDGKSKSDNISFDTTTDMAGMLLILSTKKLVPHTDEEYLEYKKKDISSADTIPQVKRQMYSLNTIWSVLSGKGKDVISAFTKKLKEKEEESLNYALFTQGGLMRRLSDGWIGKALDTFDLNVLDDMAGDIEIEGQKFGWEKIEGVYKYLDSFHAAYNAYGPPGMGMASGMIRGAVDKYKSGSLTMKDRWNVAGSLLYSMKKMKSGYTQKQTGLPAGTYVKLLMGEKYYHHYMRHYRDLELQSKVGGESGKEAQERLNMLEYNFLISNVRGGDVLEKKDPYLVNDNPGDMFYFQNMYSRDFAGELSTLLGDMKAIDFNTNSKDVNDLVASNNFEHVYNECKDHMGAVRMKDCLNELVALQKMAKDSEQADKVSQLFMSGILSGVFMNNMSKDNKSTLKKIMRNAGIPYANLIDSYDGPEKLQQLLILATGNTAADFSKFTYGEKNTSYHPDNFQSLVEKQDKVGMIASFETWFNDHKEQIIPFLHMDQGSMKTQYNMIHVWKSQDPELKIFGKKVDPKSKKVVNEVLKDFYYNTGGRSITIDELNYDSELSHTASMVDQTFPVVNKYTEGKWDDTVKDHAELIWGNIKSHVPKGLEPTENKYQLSWNIDNFFRYFQGIGEVTYTKSAMEGFYKYMRLAQQQSNPRDRKRLIWFYMTNMVYGKGPVPKEVEESFKNYMSYFEENFNNFNESLASLHTYSSDGDNFAYIFREPQSMTYLSNQERSKIVQDKQQNQYSNRAINTDTTLVNHEMDQENKRSRGGGRMYGNTNKKMGKSVDGKMRELWGIQEEFDGAITATRTVSIDTNNQSNIDLSVIQGDRSNGSSAPVPPRFVPRNKQKGQKNTNTGDDDVRDEIDSMKEALGLY